MLWLWPTRNRPGKADQTDFYPNRRRSNGDPYEISNININSSKLRVAFKTARWTRGATTVGFVGMFSRCRSIAKLSFRSRMTVKISLESEGRGGRLFMLKATLTHCRSEKTPDSTPFSKPVRRGRITNKTETGHRRSKHAHGVRSS